MSAATKSGINEVDFLPANIGLHRRRLHYKLLAIIWLIKAKVTCKIKKMFAQILQKNSMIRHTRVTCKTKHFCNFFILHVTTAYI